jgi:hypothetical protein
LADDLSAGDLVARPAGRRHHAEPSGISSGYLQRPVELSEELDPRQYLKLNSRRMGGEIPGVTANYIHYHSQIHEVLGVARGSRRNAVLRQTLT